MTLRADSLATTDAEFHKTLLDRHEEAQNHLNALQAQLITRTHHHPHRTVKIVKS